MITTDFGMEETPEQKKERLIRERCQMDFGENEVNCKLCGKALPRVDKLFFGRVINLGYRPCDCDGYAKTMLEIENELLADERRRRDIEQSIKIKGLFKNCGMGERFRQRTFRTYRAKTNGQAVALNVALQFVEAFKADRKTKGLFFSGSVGTGKTHLAAAIAHEAMHMVIPVLFGTATSLLTRIKDGWSDDTDKAAVDVLCKVPLLVIDDLGKEYAKRNSDGWSWVHEQLYHVINRRYEDYLPMVITTNLDLEELAKKLDPSMVSRIVESCDGVECKWDDYRYRGNAS